MSRFCDRRVGKAVLSLLLMTAVAACDDKKSGAPQQQGGGPAIEVSVVTVQPHPVALTEELPGRTSAFRVAEVRPQVTGIIQKRLFEEGSDVKAGQQLYQIDPATYQATYDSARADLDKAEAGVLSVKARAARYAQLVTANAISKQDYDDIVASLKQDQATVASARAAVESARINLDYTRVYSPISGRIGQSLMTEGALATANQASALATVQQLDPIYVDVTQSAADLLRLRREIEAGHLQGADHAQAPVTLTLEGGIPYDQPGKLLFSDVTVDQTTGSVRLRALFPNPRHELLPGMFVRAAIQEGMRDTAITVPQPAVSRKADGSATVWVVGSDDKVSLRPVQTAQALGDQWLITSGLRSGERVVVEGIQKVGPGATVHAAPFGGEQKPPGESQGQSPSRP